METNTRIKEILLKRAKARGSSLKWNANTLILAYTILATTILLALRAVNTAIIAVVAVLGLAVIWIYSYQQAKIMERQYLKDELRIYSELLEHQAQLQRDADLNKDPAEAKESPLTDRELQVLRLLGEGKSNKETASILHISDQTVKNHISHIFSKLGVNDRTSAVIMAINQGWIRKAEIETHTVRQSASLDKKQ